MNFRVEDRLEGAIKFNSWKAKLLYIMQENEIEYHLTNDSIESKAEAEKAKYKKDGRKAKRILMDSVKDHLIRHIAGIRLVKNMFDHLVRLFESNNTNRKLALRNKLREVGMYDSDSVNSYLMKVSELQD